MEHLPITYYPMESWVDFEDRSSNAPFHSSKGSSRNKKGRGSSQPRKKMGSSRTRRARKLVLYEDDELMLVLFEFPVSEWTSSEEVASVIMEQLPLMGARFKEPDPLSAKPPKKKVPRRKLGEITWAECRSRTNEEIRGRLSDLVLNNIETFWKLKANFSVFQKQVKAHLASFSTGNVAGNCTGALNDGLSTDLDIKLKFIMNLTDDRLWKHFDLSEKPASSETFNVKDEENDDSDANNDDIKIPGLGRLSSLDVNSKVDMNDILRPIRDELFQLIQQLYDHCVQCSRDRAASSTTPDESISVGSPPNHPDVPTLDTDSVHPDDDGLEVLKKMFKKLWDSLDHFLNCLRMYQNLVIRYLREKRGRPERSTLFEGEKWFCCCPIVDRMKDQGANTSCVDSCETLLTTDQVEHQEPDQGANASCVDSCETSPTTDQVELPTVIDIMDPPPPDF